MWISTEIPSNFRASVRFRTEHPEGKFIIGVGNGEEWKPDYHFVMNPIWTALKKYLDSPDHWDRYLHLTRDDANVIKPDTPFDVVFERNNGIATIHLNGNQLFTITEEREEINRYHYLFIAGTAVIEDLRIDQI
jgi:hypothetical protein